MAFPLWTNQIIGSGFSDDGSKYTYAATLLVLVFPILAFLRTAAMDGIILRGMLTFLLILIGVLSLSIVINITHYSDADLMTCAVRITAPIMFVTLITTIEMNVQARQILRPLLPSSVKVKSHVIATVAGDHGTMTSVLALTLHLGSSLINRWGVIFGLVICALIVAVQDREGRMRPLTAPETIVGGTMALALGAHLV
jgi:hypothetical protein